MRINFKPKYYKDVNDEAIEIYDPKIYSNKF